MKYIILIVIKLYWLIPSQFKRKCIFKESCSMYVYRNTHDNGFMIGIKSLLYRIKICRPNYRFIILEKKEYVILADNSLISKEKTTL